jgi:hypothetical protein
LRMDGSGGEEGAGGCLAVAEEVGGRGDLGGGGKRTTARGKGAWRGVLHRSESPPAAALPQLTHQLLRHTTCCFNTLLTAFLPPLPPAFPLPPSPCAPSSLLPQASMRGTVWR